MNRAYGATKLLVVRSGRSEHVATSQLRRARGVSPGSLSIERGAVVRSEMDRAASAPEKTPLSRRGFREDIQGLRAVAVVLVVLYHVGIPGIHGGYVGVDVFFVISGYLISGHLLDSLRVHGRIRFGDFYSRRARRILPASFSVIAGTALVSVFVVPPILLPRVLGDAIAAVLMVPNYVFAARETDYLADQSPSVFQHYWSLGVEEQFYLVFPVVLVLLFVLIRRRFGVLAIVIASIAVASFVLSVVITFDSQPLAFFLLRGRAWEFLVGALLHFLPRIASPMLASVGGWAGLGLILSSAAFFGSSAPFPGPAAAVPVLGSAAVLYFGSMPALVGPVIVLRTKLFQFFGLISYSLYLVHWPILVLAQLGDGVRSDALPIQYRFVVGFLGATLIAYLLYRFVEAPARNIRGRWRSPRWSLGSALVACAVLVGMLIGITHWAENREGSLGPAVAEAPVEPNQPPPITSVAPSNLTPALDEAMRSIPDMYRDGCHQLFDSDAPRACSYGNEGGDKHVVLFGDSHAAQWLPALQEFAAVDERVEVASYTKSGCPAFGLSVMRDAAPYASCDRWRSAAIAQIASDQPDLVVISSATLYELDGTSAREQAVVWKTGVQSTVEALTSAGSRVLVIADTPRFDYVPAVCVAAHPRDLDECAGPRRSVIDDSIAAAERQGALDSGGRYVDLNNYICGPDECPMVIANLLVYRDEHHLTVPFVKYLSPALSADVTQLLDER